MRTQLVIMTLLLLSASVVVAGDHGHKDDHGGLLGHRGGGLLCPRCTEPCYPTVTKGKETKHCWDVEQKVICIPRITWPWEAKAKSGHGKGHGHAKSDACGCGAKGKGKGAHCPDANCIQPKCGRTKVVNVLMKVPYECSVCKYSFEINKGVKEGTKVVPAPKLDSAATPAPARRLQVAPIVHVND